MVDASAAQSDLPNFMDLCAAMHKHAEQIGTFSQLLHTDAKIAQTPKELVWTLNKAKLYRYTPVLPADRADGHPPVACRPQLVAGADGPRLPGHRRHHPFVAEAGR